MKKFLCLVFSLCVISTTFSKERKPVYDFKRNMVSIFAKAGSFPPSKYSELNYSRLTNLVFLTSLGWSIKMGKSNFYFLHNVQFFNNRTIEKGGSRFFPIQPLLRISPSDKIIKYDNTFSTDFNVVYSFYELMKVRWFDIDIGAGWYVGYIDAGDKIKYTFQTNNLGKTEEIKVTEKRHNASASGFNTGVSALLRIKFLITKNVNLFTGMKTYVRVAGRDGGLGSGIPIPFVGITYNF